MQNARGRLVEKESAEAETITALVEIWVEACPPTARRHEAHHRRNIGILGRRADECHGQKIKGGRDNGGWGMKGRRRGSKKLGWRETWTNAE